MPRLIWVFAGRTDHIAGFLMRRLIQWLILSDSTVQGSTTQSQNDVGILNEPRHEKTCLRGLRPGRTQICLLSYRDNLGSWNFGYIEVLYYPGSEQQRCWSDCVNAQADLCLYCSHRHKTGFLMTWLNYNKTNVLRVRAMRLFACEPKTVWSENMGYVDLFILSLCLCHVMRSSVNFLPFVWFQWNCWCFENHFHTNSHFTVLKHFPLTHISLASHFWDIGKQCRPRSDTTERGIWSGSSLFDNRNIYSK